MLLLKMHLPYLLVDATRDVLLGASQDYFFATKTGVIYQIKRPKLYSKFQVRLSRVICCVIVLIGPVMVMITHSSSDNTILLLGNMHFEYLFHRCIISVLHMPTAVFTDNESTQDKREMCRPQLVQQLIRPCVNMNLRELKVTLKPPISNLV